VIFIIISPIIVFISAAALGMISSGRKYIQFCIASVASLMAILSSSIILSLVLKQNIIAMTVGSWMTPYGITFVADRFSTIMILLSNFIGFICIIYSYFDIDDNRVRHGFYPMLLALLAGANGAILAGDLFNLYVWFEVLLIGAFSLLTLGNERKQLKGSLPYVFINLFASTMMLLSVGALYGVTGSLNMAEISSQLDLISEIPFRLTIAILFFLSFAIKASIVPFFFWLPVSYHTAPVTVTALFSALLTKVSIYCLIRIFSLFFYIEIMEIKTILLITAGLTMVIGVFGAAGQSDFRRILSFHIVSQIGYMVMGLAIFTAYSLAGAALFIIHNMLIKTTLFLISGIAERIFDSGLLKQQGNLYRSHPMLAVVFLMSAFSLTGLPPLSGFWGKLILTQAGLRTGQGIVVGVSLFVSVITLFSMTKIWIHSFWSSEQQSNEVIGAIIYPVYFLCFISFAPALFPGLILEYFLAIGEDLMQPSLYRDAVHSLREVSR